ncbi:tetratricopeptide repeat protein [Brevundimonas sp.]|jgi:Flp pilus assembly protein TadD|uniref:tetratricopeptide repeat protein n=1 Tax=Brevundimonas sp. TaxID=1871086 RepID=UPI002E0F50B8|nr:tetratricopeptide repeat protein [Brevundimonas sp.]
MSRTLLLAATALCLLTTPAVAQQAAGASSTDRAAYERMDPLSRSLFWSQEFEKNPSDPEAAAALPRALRELGRHQEAAEAAERALVVQPDNVDALLEAGRAHIARGQAFYGVAHLERAARLAPRDWRPLSLLGVAYEQVKRPDDAADAWARGLALSPDNPAILANMAMGPLTSGDLVTAEDLLRRAAAHPDAGLQVRQNLALVLGLKGDLAEAERMLRRDLPPEVADANLAWIRQRVETGSAGARTWSSLQ